MTGRALRVSIDDGTPSVLISATALSTVIDVLVENASRHGHGTVTVEASPARVAARRSRSPTKGACAAIRS